MSAARLSCNQLPDRTLDGIRYRLRTNGRLLWYLSVQRDADFRGLISARLRWVQRREPDDAALIKLVAVSMRQNENPT